jgi:hypothetical protein
MRTSNNEVHKTSSPIPEFMWPHLAALELGPNFWAEEVPIEKISEDVLNNAKKYKEIMRRQKEITNIKMQIKRLINRNPSAFFEKI